MSEISAASPALLGGDPVRTRPFPPRPGIGAAEREAVAGVLDSGVLSQFLGGWTEEFWGGPRVRGLERAWEARFGVRHAISMNSATSALYAAAAAAGVGPGDEVIVSPYTMTASAACALVQGALPVFADIDDATFCLDPDSVRERITERTKAIVAVDIFGLAAGLDELMEIAREHDLVVIEDAAQAPGAAWRGRPAGTLGHIGVFSLNYHKPIQCGEGGVAVTDDDRLAERLALVRNHAEAVVGDMGADHPDLVGFNYRLGELEAAIAAVQLERLDALVEPRIRAAERLTAGLADLEGVHPPFVPEGARHVYYVHAVRLDPERLGVSRARFAAALRAEGVPVAEGYVAPLYRQPLYQRRTAPAFALAPGGGPSYADGTSPVCERLHERELVYHDLVHADMGEDDLDDIVAAFRKVHAWRDELRRPGTP